ncbi:nucleoside-diphosphate-sugar epimerase [Kribbella solani]|uniref:Nucleoside-diphosphate-sugar epimerase n=2 Tax=Kribbella solani TaxID=236067 RepID=A0A841DYS6_9ACTN|nr:nucleoside-diphosphate-sugar epimerase [Kribbella solani]
MMVFGAGGFLGARICALLADRGIEYRGLSRTRSEPFRRCDLTSMHPYALDTQIGMYKPTVIVNAVGATLGEPADLVGANVIAVAALLNSVRDNAGHARFVQLGSAAEYGAGQHGTSLDEQTPPRPLGPYGITKLAGSELVLRAQRAGWDAVVLRIFDVIGPGAPESTLTGRVIRDLRSRQLIEVGSLDVWRDFVDVRDVAEAVLAVALADGKLPPVLNVGTGRATLARDVAGQLFERSGQPARIVDDDQTALGAAWQQADITLIGETLGWSPKVALDQSLADSWSESV